MSEQSVHRVLDEAFAGVEPTAEVQDLKEEIRANLVARVAELEARGLAPADAVRTAVDEVGDLRAVVAEVAGGGAALRSDAWGEHGRLAAMHRVRPRPAAVVGLVVLASALVAAVGLVALGATGVTAASPASAVLESLAAALLAGAIVVVALRQETTVHYPMPARRAVAWGASAASGVLAVVLGATYAGDPSRLGLVVAAVGLGVVAVAGLVTLGVTQTNRTKSWVREAADRSQDRFTQDPAAAARFGIYSAALWLAAFAAVVVVGLAAGWLWSWTPLVAALAVEMVLLARMQFPAGRRPE